MKTRAIATDLSIEELFIAIQPTAKDRREAIAYLRKQKSHRTHESGGSRERDAVTENLPAVVK